MFGNRNCKSQAGSSNVKAIIWTFVLFAFMYVCFRVLPVYMADYQFQDTMQSTARFASINRQSSDQIRQNLLKEAQKADLPIKLQDIKVVSRNGRVDISANYSVIVDLHVYQWTLNFHPTASNSQL